MVVEIQHTTKGVLMWGTTTMMFLLCSLELVLDCNCKRRLCSIKTVHILLVKVFVQLTCLASRLRCHSRKYQLNILESDEFKH